VCPVRALKFVAEAPNQEETNGYQVNLRNDNWLRLGLVDDSRQPTPPALPRVDLGFGPPAKPKPAGDAPGAKPGGGAPGAKPKA